tara:strand:- start:411 stop:638 length:228 start_codon:yes stop_codon:yes gene_type:complete
LPLLTNIILNSFGAQIGGYGLMVYAPIGIYIISTAGSNSEAFFAQTAFGLILSLYGAPMLTWMVESFPVESRLTR